MRFFGLLFILVTSLSFGAPPKNRPKLIFFVVIDQFRGDYLTRFQSRFTGGFKTLVEKGAWFPAAQFDILQNMTGPGHAAFLTGAYPYMTGVPINEWYEVQKKESVYCAKGSSGLSPENLVGSTLGDELKAVYPDTKVVSLSVKDRAAILMGGHRADNVIWMDIEKFSWTSSAYYPNGGKLPSWVQKENEKLRGRRDKNIWETPEGLRLLASLTENTLQNANLGKGKGTDILAVSFSSHDYAGHEHGPESKVMEEMTLEEDKILGRLFETLNKTVPGGMKNVLVVLTADHGAATNPELAASQKLGGGRIDQTRLLSEMNERMTERFGNVDNGWVLMEKEMNFYLNPLAIADKKLDRVVIEEALKAELLKTNGIAHVFSGTDVRRRHLPAGILEKQILNAYYPGRSGDVIAILKPFWISGKDPVNHMTGYSYDRTVPIILMGPQIRSGVFATRAEPVDIAPTLAFLTGVIPPSQSHGRVLSEILR